MSNEDLAIKVENLSKRYRIGLKEEMYDSVGGAVFGFIKNPWKNYLKYRSLYKFSDIKSEKGNSQFNNSSDVIWALKNVSFEAHKGEIIGIVGANGAGKSTLLKILSKITDPTIGRIEMCGRISSLLEVGTGFHPELTGKENVYLNGTILGMRKKEIDLKFDEIVDFSGVEKFLDTPVKRYSSGMRVRLAFSVAAHLEPEILVIDEVLAVGDANFQKKCLNKMEEIREGDRTILFVSHNLPAITRLCSRTILLDSGEIVADGPTQEVVNQYTKSEESMKAERHWPVLSDAPGDDVARLVAVRARTDNGSISSTMDIRQPIKLEMEYKVLKEGYEYYIYFQVVNENGILAFTTIENDPAWRACPRPTGHYKSHTIIPGNFLSEGIYHIVAVMKTLNPWIQRFGSSDYIAFQVVDSLDGDSARVDHTGGIGGVVRPMLKWKTKITPE